MRRMESLTSRAGQASGGTSRNILKQHARRPRCRRPAGLPTSGANSTPAAGCSARAAISAPSCRGTRSVWRLPPVACTKAPSRPAICWSSAPMARRTGRRPASRPPKRCCICCSCGRGAPEPCCTRTRCGAPCCRSVTRPRAGWPSPDSRCSRVSKACAPTSTPSGCRSWTTTRTSRAWPVSWTSRSNRFPAAHAFLIRRHGLYTWGTDLDQATRHIEILEFLLETTGRM